MYDIAKRRIIIARITRIDIFIKADLYSPAVRNLSITIGMHEQASGKIRSRQKRLLLRFTDIMYGLPAFTFFL